MNKKELTWPPEHVKILLDFHDTKSASELSEIFGRSRSAIWAKANKLGLSMVKYGNNHHSTKASEWDVKMIRELAKEGMKKRLIAEKLEVSLGTVRSVAGYHSRFTK